MPAKSFRPDFQIIVLAIALISGIISAILFWWERDSLWEDEIIAITHGLQPFPGFFVEVLRNDIHPFFYFLLLKLWTLPNIGSDSWALASSLVAALCSAAVIAFATYHIHGRLAALWATAIFCILPTFAWSAANLRMYGLMPGIAVACWYANREYLRTGRLPWIVGVLALQFAQTYSHAIGFFFATFFALAALLEQWQTTDGRRLRIWMAVQVISLLLMLPVMASALVRGTEPLSTPDLFSLASYPVQLVTVWKGSDDPVVVALGGVTFLFLVAFALTNKTSRIAVLVIPCGALLASIIVSGMGKPMFKSPVFTANLVPFLVIGAAVGIAQLRSRTIRSVAIGFVALLIMAKWIGLYKTPIFENYKPAAQYIVANAQPGDIVIVPNVSVFWGIMRYAVGPTWGYPLEIMQLQSNEAWTRLKGRLGPHWVEQLGLNPASDYVVSQGIKYVIGFTAEHHTREFSRAWVIHRNNYKVTVNLGSPARRKSTEWFGKELTVSMYFPDTSGTSSIPNPP